MLPRPDKHPSYHPKEEAALIRLPSEALSDVAAPLRDSLHQLDVAVEIAVSGVPVALEKMAQLWSEVTKALRWEQVEQARELYLRYAVQMTREVQDRELHRPEVSVAALEVISLLAFSER